MFVPIVNGLSEGGSGEAVMGAAALSIFGTITTGMSSSLCGCSLYEVTDIMRCVQKFKDFLMRVGLSLALQLYFHVFVYELI